MYKAPGLHPSDVRKVQVVCTPELMRYTGHLAKYGIFFPTVGPRAVVDEMANSDLDGDMYWICKHPEVREADLTTPSLSHTYSYADSGIFSEVSPTTEEELEGEFRKLAISSRFEPWCVP